MLKEFAMPVFLTMAIAFPVMYWLVQNWLKNFAYRIDMALWPLPLSGTLAFDIAFLTVNHQAIRTAATDQIDSMSYE